MHEVLQKARDSRNLTNADIARLLGRSESLISKVMRGIRTPPDDIYRVLGLPEPEEKKKRKSA